MNEPQGNNGSTGQPNQGLYTVDTSGLLCYPPREPSLVAGTWVNFQTPTSMPNAQPPEGVIITQGTNINHQHQVLPTIHTVAPMGPIIMEQQLSHQPSSQVIQTIDNTTLNQSLSQSQNINFIQNSQPIIAQSHDQQPRGQLSKDGLSRSPLMHMGNIQNATVSQVPSVLQDISHQVPEHWQSIQTITPISQYSSNQDLLKQDSQNTLQAMNSVIVPTGRLVSPAEGNASETARVGGTMNLLYFCNICNVAFTNVNDLQTHSHSKETSNQQSVLSQPNLSQSTLTQSTLPQQTVSQSELSQSAISQSTLSQLALSQPLPTQVQVPPSMGTLKWAEGLSKEALVEVIQPSDVNIQESWQTPTQPLVIKPKPMKDFVCKTCAQSFPNKTALGVHMKIHRTQKFPCTICNKQFTYRHTLKEHQKIHLGSREFSCHECGKTFRRKEHRDRHLTIHTGAKDFACQLCEAKFSRKYDLKLHKRGVHDQKGIAINSLRSEQKKDKVPSSGTDKTKTGPEILQPVPGPVLQEPVFRSNYNSHQYSTDGTVYGTIYNNTINGLNDGSVVPPGPEPVKQLFLPEPSKPDQPVCGQCSKVFSSEKFLKLHLEECLTTRRYYCKKCNRGFTRNSYLKAHSQLCRTTETVAFLCPHCPKGFKWKQNLTEHIKVHGKTSDLGCEKCNKKFSSFRSYKRHVKKHVDEKINPVNKTNENVTIGIGDKNPDGKQVIKKPHVCSICGTSFRFINNLRDHSHIHSGVRPHKCQYCPKTFIRKDHRMRHEQAIHKGVKPFCCTICGIAYTRKSTLLLHIERDHKNPDKAPVRKTTGEKIEIATKNEETNCTEYKCYLCEAIFMDIQLLQEHFKTHTTKIYSCPTCDEVFVKERTLELHINAHIKRNEIQFFQCQVCAKCFINKASYMKHCHIAEMTQFSCNICKKTFRKKSSVGKHVLMKHGAKKVVNSNDDMKDKQINDTPRNANDIENNAQNERENDKRSKNYEDQIEVESGLQIVIEEDEMDKDTGGEPKKSKEADVDDQPRNNNDRTKEVDIQSGNDKIQKEIDISELSKGVTQHEDDASHVKTIENESDISEPVKTNGMTDSGLNVKVADQTNITTKYNNTAKDGSENRDVTPNVVVRANEENTMSKDITTNKDITPNENIAAISTDVPFKGDESNAKEHKTESTSQETDRNPIDKTNIIETIASEEVQKNMDPLKQIKTLKMTSFTCGICNIVLKTRWLMLIHLKNHVTKRVYMCKYCKSSFKNQSALIDHIQQHHTNMDAQIFRCIECGTMCSSLKGLATHHHKKHDNRDKTYKCFFRCSKSFSSKESLERHIYRQHNTKGRDKVCKFCDRTFISKIKLEDHQRGHTGEKLICEICGKKFKFRNNLGTHMKEQHNNKKTQSFLCTLCNKEFKSLRYLKTHLLTNIHWEGGEGEMEVGV